MRIITPKELTQALELLGWKKDKYGHLQTELKGAVHRLVLGPRGALLQRLDYVTPTTLSPSRTSWKEADKFSYDQISVTQNSQIRMGSRLF